MSINSSLYINISQLHLSTPRPKVLAVYLVYKASHGRAFIGLATDCLTLNKAVQSERYVSNDSLICNKISLYQCPKDEAT